MFNFKNRCDRLEKDACKNRKVGGYQIGELLSLSPVGKDSIWPHEAVRDIIERCETLELERGLEVELLNRRGASVHGRGDGGEQERKIAEEYERQAEKIKFEWPRTAAMLSRLAKSHGRDVAFWDEKL